MRAIVAAFAALGGGVILAAFVVSVAHGDGCEVDWLLVGPLPFCLIGLVAFLRRPATRWSGGWSASAPRSARHSAR